MLNFRKLKQDFSSSIVKEGRELFDKQKVVSAKLLHLDSKTMRISGRILGQYDNYYESEIEIDRIECETIDSDCDCPYNYDCQHLAALFFIWSSISIKFWSPILKRPILTRIAENLV